MNPTLAILVLLGAAVALIVVAAGIAKIVEISRNALTNSNHNKQDF